MKLGELAASVQWVYGLVIDETAVTAQAVAAARHYHGYGDIRSMAGLPDAVLNGETEISDSEWSVIKPLFMLYIERENARALEASRSQGIEVYGRAISEIEPDIRQYETGDLPRLAFSCQPESI